MGRDAVPRLLFVGGNFARKGGLILLEAARRLRVKGVRIELDVVTRDDVPADDSVRVHRGLIPTAPTSSTSTDKPTSSVCRRWATASDSPTPRRGRWILPCIGTDVGAVGQIVETSGPVCSSVGDADELAQSIERLVADVDLRLRLGATPPPRPRQVRRRPQCRPARRPASTDSSTGGAEEPPAAHEGRACPRDHRASPPRKRRTRREVG